MLPRYTKEQLAAEFVADPAYKASKYAGQSWDCGHCGKKQRFSPAVNNSRLGAFRSWKKDLLGRTPPIIPAGCVACRRVTLVKFTGLIWSSCETLGVVSDLDLGPYEALYGVDTDWAAER